MASRDDVIIKRKVYRFYYNGRSYSNSKWAKLAAGRAAVTKKVVALAEKTLGRGPNSHDDVFWKDAVHKAYAEMFPHNVDFKCLKSEGGLCSDGGGDFQYGWCKTAWHKACVAEGEKLAILNEVSTTTALSPMGVGVTSSSTETIELDIPTFQCIPCRPPEPGWLEMVFVKICYWFYSRRMREHDAAL